MIYVIKGKPYVKVANYYKEISISKNGKNYFAEPVGGPETRIEDTKVEDVISTSIENYVASKKTSKSEMVNDIKDID